MFGLYDAWSALSGMGDARDLNLGISRWAEGAHKWYISVVACHTAPRRRFAYAGSCFNSNAKTVAAATPERKTMMMTNDLEEDTSLHGAQCAVSSVDART